MRISDWSSDVCSSDLLTRVAEIDHSTVELHLTLGNLFRKRGEIDRALRIHEALLARTGLSDDVQAQERRELAYDYLRAGVMDHAEAQLEKLATGGRYVSEATDQNRRISQPSRDWKTYVEVGKTAG